MCGGIISGPDTPTGIGAQDPLLPEPRYVESVLILDDKAQVTKLIVVVAASDEEKICVLKAVWY